ncbi:MAG: hypothetical protein ACJAWL_000995 [Motiliproteus sp.]|jgi:hypothetical protein
MRDPLLTLSLTLTLTLTLTLLSGCQILTDLQASKAPAALPEVVEAQTHADLDLWLSELSRLLALNEEQAEAQLQQAVTSQAELPQRLFRYALLNQQLKDRLGWIRARDALQQLAADAQLSLSLLSLVQVLQFHNQAMINADARHTRLLNALQEENLQQQQLAAELRVSQQEVFELSQKIDALTNLEKSMSIRRALTTDTPKGTVDD